MLYYSFCFSTLVKKILEIKKPLRNFEGSRSHFFKKLWGLGRNLGFLLKKSVVVLVDVEVQLLRLSMQITIQETSEIGIFPQFHE